jgi:hypothetical protein
MEHMRSGGLIATRWPVAGGVWLLAALGWSGLLMVGHFPRLTPEPVYYQHPISWWLTNSNTGPRWAGSMILPPATDSNAIPFLIAALEGDGWLEAANFRKWVWPQLPAAIQRHLPVSTNAAIARLNAAAMLCQMGPVARPAIPGLIRILKEDNDSFVRWWAAQALGNVGAGGSVSSALTAALRDKDRRVREVAAMSLRRIEREGTARAKWQPGELPEPLHDWLAPYDPLTRRSSGASTGMTIIAPDAAAKAGIKLPSP